MIILQCVLFAAIVVVAYRLFIVRQKNKDAELSGGFSHYVGVYMSEKELLRIMVLEELGNATRREQFLLVKKSRVKRLVLTILYIFINFVVVMCMYYRSEVVCLCALVTLIYILLYAAADPVKEVCKVVKRQPNREISQIVSEMCVPQKPANRLVWGIIAFVLSMGIFMLSTGQDRFVIGKDENGYGIASYSPAFYRNDTVVIPEEFEGQPIVGIGREAFKNMAFIREVEIPDTVKYIGSSAFEGCKKLEQVELPENLTKLYGSSFKDCKRLREITIPEGVTEIRGNTFEGCKKLETVVLHDGIVDIHAFAFQNCESLEEIQLPSGITEIHERTFSGCTSLRKIEIPEGVTRIAAHAFRDCTALRNVSVPDSLLEIGSSAFRNCTSLKSIRLPSTTSVNERAFKESPTIITTK